METWQIIAIVVAVFGVVIGNLMLLKHAAKMDFKVPKSDDNEDKKSPDE
ncbi:MULTISPECIES: DUF2897 family protein [Pseudoalteromonas]|jgi:hypothetical protein|uniref:DUF2897 family protein n=1 Tax=Pseudoalteromonas lipolytica TaxID=570156 RepID=A0ABU8SVH6_9GAMM|nr:MULTISPECIES: DUF2897 family protein [Pseudoalteromonas]MAH27852.1 DUF2897 domain-containing protein [Pseudoalteromonadaceae bacterium]MDC3191357.1 DUF2897 family protein [Pseudoalteromonas elyakovii]MED5512388.1 DUF2897 family protein [Pseudomonadota bacterium]KPV98552.1 hypothetical protein AN213_03611 [Pseudoalteromonas sp. P1-8]MBC7009434.1 DUF2897 family protein [Pseudoalteromonas sp. BZK2]|tara:strand:- start:754 stop:900 length:147 start_codon:yes stop_codon:yes gene_type:complete